MPLVTEDSVSTAAHPWGWVGLDAALQPLADPRFVELLHRTDLPFSIVRDPQGELAATTALPENNTS